MSDSYSGPLYNVEQTFIYPVVVDLDGTAADIGDVDLGAIDITALGILITETVANDATAAVVSLEDASNTELATLSVTDATAAKTELETSVSGQSITSGNLTFKHKTQGTDGSSSAGQGYVYIKYKKKLV